MSWQGVNIFQCFITTELQQHLVGESEQKMSNSKVTQLPGEMIKGTMKKIHGIINGSMVVEQ